MVGRYPDVALAKSDLALQEGQTPRFLQENATKKLCLQPSQYTCAAP